LGHTRQIELFDAAVTFDAVPALQFVHTVDPFDVAYVPGIHFTHVLFDVAPGIFEDVPAGHNAHSVDPFDTEYVPAGHAWHEKKEEPPVRFEKYPTGQRVHTVPPELAEYEPAEHNVQLLAFDALNEPAGHDEHADAFAPEYQPAAHNTHALIPDAFENDPAGHEVHDDEPAREYVPAKHVEQYGCEVPEVILMRLLVPYVNDTCESSYRDTLYGDLSVSMALKSSQELTTE